MSEKTGIKEFNAVIAGVGGQGNLLASEILATAAVKAGHRVRVGETFGAAQRGGPVASYIRVGSEVYSPILDPGRADLVVGFEPAEGLRNAVSFMRSGGAVVLNSKPIIPTSVSMGIDKYPSIEEIVEALRRMKAETIIVFDATAEAERIGNVIVMNIVMLGAMAGSGVLPFSAETLKEVIKERLTGPLLDMNLKAFDAGLTMSEKHKEVRKLKRF
jgi:indolepyruvate ferredoxin oxidoreductase beta subunit